MGDKRELSACLGDDERSEEGVKISERRRNKTGGMRKQGEARRKGVSGEGREK